MRLTKGFLVRTEAPQSGRTPTSKAFGANASRSSDEGLALLRTSLFVLSVFLVVKVVLPTRRAGEDEDEKRR